MSLFDDDVGGYGAIGGWNGAQASIVGGTEIIGGPGVVGAQLDNAIRSIVGGDLQGAVNQLANVSQQMKEVRAIDPNAVMVQNREPSSRRYWHAPFPATAFATTVAANLQMQPQELFRTERMFIPSNLANDYNITQLFVGQKNQLLVAGEINGSVFSEVAVRSFLNLDTANIGNTINVTLRNDGLTTTTPRPDLLGTAAV